MKYANIKYFSTTNGTGVRTSVFVSGCRIHCNGCFNKEAWDFDYGKEFTDEVIDRIIESIEPVYCDGLSILGGEPLDERNLYDVEKLVDRFREKFGSSKTIWLYTGYYYNSLFDDKRRVADKCDVIVDGPFDIEKMDLNLSFRGSSNQHIIKTKET